ncbi:hypothetical protein EUGRSUZ_I01420 [Eucalyptus grandis]|uniref:Uncharacterized protein n=2 Tax=Eucalyptus grandis TaxID=71139 RepID=A0ACC3JGT9_EUCGR|nr:hypothetical protein EUGRSUZ_I01420 [Eucalyptus grandis]
MQLAVKPAAAAKEKERTSHAIGPRSHMLDSNSADAYDNSGLPPPSFHRDILDDERWYLAKTDQTSK